jgi:hypothetical protein
MPFPHHKRMIGCHFTGNIQVFTSLSFTGRLQEKVLTRLSQKLFSVDFVL